MRILQQIGRVAAAVGLLVAPAALSAQDVAIRNATIATITNGDIQNGTIVVQKGKITAVGANVQIPAGITVIDGTGKFVMPGIIDAHSHAALENGINEGSESVTPEVHVQLKNDDPVIYRALAGGVTAANQLHGSANTIGGQANVIRLKWGMPADSMYFKGAYRIVKFALGENVTRKNSQQVQQATGQPLRYPATRMGQEEVLRDAFTRARDYKAEWDDYNARVKKGEKNLVPPRRDLELEPLVEVLEGKRFVHAHSYRADEMLMLLELAKEFGFTVKTLQHGLEGYKIASEIAQAGTGLSSFADEWSYKIEAYDAIPYNVPILLRHGVVATINSDSDERARRLNIDAAKLMRYGGLTEDEALKTITYNGAVQLGIQDRVGSIETGKDADVVIWSGDPLSVYSSAETTFIDGEIFFDKQRDLAMRDQMARERAALEAADRGTRAVVP